MGPSTPSILVNVAESPTCKTTHRWLKLDDLFALKKCQEKSIKIDSHIHAQPHFNRWANYTSHLKFGFRGVSWNGGGGMGASHQGPDIDQTRSFMPCNTDLGRNLESENNSIIDHRCSRSYKGSWCFLLRSQRKKKSFHLLEVTFSVYWPTEMCQHLCAV